MLEANAEKYILFEDKDIIVCRKPAGIAVQNARIGAMDLESGLKNYLASAGNGRQIPYLAVVHRLDQPVEGVLVFARNPKAARNLSAQITAGKMEKIYLAVTFGRPAEYEKSETARSTEADSDETRSGKKHEPKILEDYLKKDGKTNTSSVVSPGTPGAKKARLSYEVLDETQDKISGKPKWLLRIHLDTGRHHQIRVQMAHAGMPLAGDRKYGSDPGIPIGTGGLALCAASLTFTHPAFVKVMKFQTTPQSPAFDGFKI